MRFPAVLDEMKRDNKSLMFKKVGDQKKQTSEVSERERELQETLERMQARLTKLETTQVDKHEIQVNTSANTDDECALKIPTELISETATTTMTTAPSPPTIQSKIKRRFAERESKKIAKVIHNETLPKS